METTIAQEPQEAPRQSTQAAYPPGWYERQREAVEWGVRQGLVKRPIVAKRKAKDEPGAG